MTHAIRTTMQPDREIEVDDAEYLDLKRQGLLVNDDGPATPQTGAPSVPAAPKKTPTTKEG